MATLTFPQKNEPSRYNQKMQGVVYLDIFPHIEWINDVINEKMGVLQQIYHQKKAEYFERKEQESNEGSSLAPFKDFNFVILVALLSMNVRNSVNFSC